MFYYPKNLMGKALLFSSFLDEENGITKQLKYLPSSECLGVEGSEISTHVLFPGCGVLKPYAIIEHILLKTCLGADTVLTLFSLSTSLSGEFSRLLSA